MSRPKAPPQSKEELRAEAARVQEALENGQFAVTKVNTRIQARCSKCGAENRVQAKPGELRVDFKCKECGHVQMRGASPGTG